MKKVEIHYEQTYYKMINRMNEIQLSVKTFQWRFSLELFVAWRYRKI